MKTFVLSLVLAALALPFAACETHHTESTKRNWDGSVTREQTTVREAPGGFTTVDQSKTTTR